MCPTCGALLYEDSQFAAEMTLYGLPQRRLVCWGGHSWTPGAPAVDPATRPHGQHAPARQILHTACAWCQEPFWGVTRQRYCSDTCVRAVDKERTDNRNARDRSRFRGDALRRIRSIAPLTRRVSTLAPYADRPRGLSMRWA